MDQSVDGIDPHDYSPVEKGTLEDLDVRNEKFAVYVKTGDKKGAGTMATISIRLFDGNGVSSLWHKLSLPFHNDFRRGHLDTYYIPPPPVRFASVVKIELECSKALKKFDWFVDYVEIKDPRTIHHFVFPVHRWFKAGRPFFVQLLDAVLPQNDKHQDQRKAELVEKRKMYEYGRENPGSVVMWDLIKLGAGVVVSCAIVQLMSGSLMPFRTINDIEQLFGKLKAIEKPIGMEHWRDDAWFGAQRVMNCNPVNVKLCRRIPEKFPLFLGLTHLKAEGVAVCTHRNLSPSHPIVRLLAPHFLNIMAINAKAVNGVLLKKGGAIDSTIAIGNAGVYQLLATRQRDFRLNVEGHLLNDLKNRGVDDTDALPFYPYRDDALLIWKALRKYVKDIVAIYYEHKKELVDDPELQQWAKDLSASSEDGGIGMKGVPGNGKFKTKEDLIEALTCIIFMCSVQHAAVNFPQYDDYAFTPNYPSHLNGDPPSKKEPKEEKELVAALPTRDKTIQIITVTKILSAKNTNSLGHFEVTYLYDERAKEAATQLRETLVEASKIMAERNKSRKYKYTILDPAFVPNSISA